MYILEDLILYLLFRVLKRIKGLISLKPLEWSLVHSKWTINNITVILPSKINRHTECDLLTILWKFLSNTMTFRDIWNNLFQCILTFVRIPDAHIHSQSLSSSLADSTTHCWPLNLTIHHVAKALSLWVFYHHILSVLDVEVQNLQ